MNALIIGRRGLGKSTLALKVATDKNKNVVIFDANNQFRSSLIRTSDVKEVESALENSDDKNPLTLSFIPDGDVEIEWDKFAKTIWQFGDYSLIIDEAHRLQKSNYVNPWLDKFMRQAPRRERKDPEPIDIIQTFHRPVDVAGIVASLADYVYIFRLTKSRDIEYIEKEWGEDVAGKVTTLRTPPEGRDVLRVDIEQDTFVILDDCREWFTNIRETPKQDRPTWIRGIHGF